MKTRLLAIPLLVASAIAAEEPVLPEQGLAIDLDAAKGLTLEDGDKVAAWQSQTPGAQAKNFVKRDEGRKEAGSGRPTLKRDVKALGGKPALDFRQQELVCMDEDTFDGLSTGRGHTWIVILSVHEQRVGLKDVNSFFGNLRNSGNYEGIWGCVDDGNKAWWGVRNGMTFGRFDGNNPQVIGPELEQGKFHILAGRMAKGSGTVELELFVNDTEAVAKAGVPVNPDGNPSRMAVGQERDAIQHPGVESFDGQIARFLVWERPLENAELASAFDLLRKSYLAPSGTESR
jgi:hypothetical protein